MNIEICEKINELEKKINILNGKIDLILNILNNRCEKKTVIKWEFI